MKMIQMFQPPIKAFAASLSSVSSSACRGEVGARQAARAVENAR